MRASPRHQSNHTRAMLYRAHRYVARLVNSTLLGQLTFHSDGEFMVVIPHELSVEYLRAVEEGISRAVAYAEEQVMTGRTDGLCR